MHIVLPIDWQAYRKAVVSMRSSVGSKSFDGVEMAAKFCSGWDMPTCE